MTKIKTLALSGAAVIAGIGAASAADIGVPPRGYAPPPALAPAPIGYNWTGAYVGITGGFGSASFGNDATVSDGSGGLLGGYVGYNIQMPSNWVVGIEGDALWSGIEGTSGAAKADIGFLSTLRGRVGIAFDRMLLYATGGLAVGRVTLDDGTIADTQTHIGGTVGGGIEMALSPSLTARLEYDFVKLNSKDYDLTTTYSTGPTANIVKAGLGFKF